MANVSDEQLREMVQHRGFKLVKSRKRKPGGDYGKFGLTDADGKALLGIDEGGLTASAAEIQDFLRKSEVGTWKQSAETTPDRPPAPKKPETVVGEENVVLRRAIARQKPMPAPPRGRKLSAPDDARQDEQRRVRPALKLVSKAEPEAGLKVRPKAALPDVPRIRDAAANDAKALARLLGELDGVAVSARQISDNLAAVRKLKGGMVVAEHDDLVGCCGWGVIPTVHRGAVGRLTMLVVDKAHRRRGIATKMVAAAEAALAKAGCKQVEVMSDITINNSHNFFRSLNFEQTSYRFMRMIDAKGTSPG